VGGEVGGGGASADFQGDDGGSEVVDESGPGGWLLCLHRFVFVFTWGIGAGFAYFDWVGAVPNLHFDVTGVFGDGA